ncbi:hypothetical protein [Methylobacterium sp. WL9]|uniref:hypothetical protein n=1 Tax=Methylobacterium sp. WL9 TaxID=2603898 RepID=UPI0011C7111E|nr:hypothetical protein [Methylobacterium sp. WL9]TXN21004.1 hypothetical protein FV217_16040 [Methylobacterium sp. WL9]
MDKVARPAPGEVQTGKKGRRTAYLIAVRHKRDLPRIYALLAPSAEAALAQLNELTTEGMGIEVVGALSRDLAQRLGLKAGEIRLV